MQNASCQNIIYKWMNKHHSILYIWQKQVPSYLSCNKVDCSIVLECNKVLLMMVPGGRHQHHPVTGIFIAWRRVQTDHWPSVTCPATFKQAKFQSPSRCACGYVTTTAISMTLLPWSLKRSKSRSTFNEFFAEH
jgi:hypothetical protein